MDFLKNHQAIVRIVKGMLGFKSFNSASITLNGIEMVRMIKKGQKETEEQFVQGTPDMLYFLAA